MCKSQKIFCSDWRELKTIQAQNYSLGWWIFFRLIWLGGGNFLFIFSTIGNKGWVGPVDILIISRGWGTYLYINVCWGVPVYIIWICFYFMRQNDGHKNNPGHGFSAFHMKWWWFSLTESFKLYCESLYILLSNTFF